MELGRVPPPPRSHRFARARGTSPTLCAGEERVRSTSPHPTQSAARLASTSPQGGGGSGFWGLKTPEINGCRIPYSSKACEAKMRNVGVHPAFFVAPFDQMAYAFRHNGLLRPALSRAAGFLILTGVAPTPCGDTRSIEFLPGTAGILPAFACARR